MIDIFSLFWLSVIDYRKQEIPIFAMIGYCLIWWQSFVRVGEIELHGFIMGMGFLIYSLLSKQRFGLADAIVLLLIGMKYGGTYLLILVMNSLIFLLLLEFCFLVIKKKKHEKLPFLPFIVFARLLM